MIKIIHEFILIAMIILALVIVAEEDLLRAVIGFALLQTLLVISLFLLKAPDVALSAIVVGALIIGIFIYTIQEGILSRRS